MAIVIPTAVQGLRVANAAGLMGIRKAAAARIADRELNELLITHQWLTASPSGTVQEGALPYRWIMRSQPWNQLNSPLTTPVGAGPSSVSGNSTLRLLTVQVSFPVQGREYSVSLSTLVDPSTQ